MVAPWEHAWLGLWFPNQLIAALPSQPSLLGFCRHHQKTLHTHQQAWQDAAVHTSLMLSVRGSTMVSKQLMSKEGLFVNDWHHPNQSQ